MKKMILLMIIITLLSGCGTNKNLNNKVNTSTNTSTRTTAETIKGKDSTTVTTTNVGTTQTTTITTNPSTTKTTTAAATTSIATTNKTTTTTKAIEQTTKPTTTTTKQTTAKTTTTTTITKKTTTTTVTTTTTQKPLTTAEVYNSMIALKSKYPDGTPWNNDNSYSWKGGIYNIGYGCAGFAFMVSDAAFGSRKATKHSNFDNIKVGDIVRLYNNSHSVIVLSISGDTYTIAEGNINESVLWGRKISLSDIKSTGTYVLTRW